MLTEICGKGGCLCQPAKEGELRCPLIVRPTSEDVVTGNIVQILKMTNPRWWLPQMLNMGLRSERFRQQVFRNLRIELWQNQPIYPRHLLPWAEGSTQVDLVISWDNPPTTVFVEAKYGSPLSAKVARSDGQHGYPADQLIRNARVGLLTNGWFTEESFFPSSPRDFVLLLLAPNKGNELVQQYRSRATLLASIPHSDRLKGLPRLPFIGDLGFRDITTVLTSGRRYLSLAERKAVDGLVNYLEFKMANLPAPFVPSRRHSPRLPEIPAAEGTSS